ncbi:hypothetical protein AH320_004224 [Salmonella enterica subsp. houtenae]|nr:hypothetical protein [Salmonella enterica subsp. houtenae]
MHSASQHRSIAASQHRSIAASQHRSIAASQHRSIAASQYFNTYCFLLVFISLTNNKRYQLKHSPSLNTYFFYAF